MNLTESLKENFSRYAALTIQKRAIIDVRDALKPSQRQCAYAQFLEKINHLKPYKKSMKSVAAALDHFYQYGDTSCYGLLMRMGKPFISRYPLEDVHGNFGTLADKSNEASARYTEMRLTELSSYLFNTIDKEVIDIWYDNYDNTEKYPAVLPTIGFYNIVNGTCGIATGIASSIPQFNLKEVNEAIVKVMRNPDVSFEEIYCPPDFSTGGILVNADAVKESLRVGGGDACKLRAVIEYDEKENCLNVLELPYSVFTNTICSQLDVLINGEENCGIERFLDLTGEKCLIKIYLTKKANYSRVVKLLYKETSLQYHYGINIEMLKDGKKPMIFGWKEALIEHVNHSKQCYLKSLEFDLRKLYAKLHIVEGLIKAIHNIQEVIKTIRSSSSAANAKSLLMANFEFSQLQTEAILNMKLSKLANLEEEKIIAEKLSLTTQITDIEETISDKDKFTNQLEAIYRKVAQKFGDKRRTQILNLTVNENGDEPIEKKILLATLTNFNNLYLNETVSLITQKRGGIGNKIKLATGEVVTDSFIAENNSTMYLFSNTGRYFTTPLSAFSYEKQMSLHEVISLEMNETVVTIAPTNISKKYIVIITKNGLIKKTLMSEYRTKKKNGVIATTLNKGDAIVSVLFVDDDEYIATAANTGKFVIVQGDAIRAIGRTSKGVRIMKLEDGVEVVAAKVFSKSDAELISISRNGVGKRTDISEFGVSNRGAIGTYLQKISADDSLVDFLPISGSTDVTISTTKTTITVPTSDFPLSQKNRVGTKMVKLKNDCSVIRVKI